MLALFMHIFMAIFKMRANICTYFKNGSPLVSSAQNIDILSGSNTSDSHDASPLGATRSNSSRCSTASSSRSARPQATWTTLWRGETLTCSRDAWTTCCQSEDPRQDTNVTNNTPDHYKTFFIADPDRRIYY